MTEAGWTGYKVSAAQRKWPGLNMIEIAEEVLQAEHARSVRIVKAEINRVRLDQSTYRSEERCLILGSLETVLTALQRGRGGQG